MYSKSYVQKNYLSILKLGVENKVNANEQVLSH